MAGDKVKLKVEVDAKEAAKQVKEMRAAAFQGINGLLGEISAAFAIKDRGARILAIQNAKASLNALREGLE